MAIVRVLLVIACLYALGAFTVLLSGRLDRWPKTRAYVIRVGEALSGFALGFLGLLLVVLLLRSVGLLPAQSGR